MRPERVMALTDGVIAVIITIMVLEMKAPHGTGLADLAEVWPVFLSYVLSFVYVAIYWNNHHHFFQLVERVDGPVLWANFHLLFWMSLLPFATAWTGEHEIAAVPTAVYGGILLANALAWVVMQRAIVRAQGPVSPLRDAIGRDLKGKLSPPLYAAGMALAFVAPLASDLIYAGVALMWLVPDKRMEAAVARR